MIRIISISPKIFKEGVTPCTITYVANSRDAGNAKVKITVSGSGIVWFIENGKETEKLEEFDISLTTNKQVFKKTVQIKVHPFDLSGAAFIKIEITDVKGNKSTDKRHITYE